MILYYAVGGGLGHLVRARAVLHTLGLEADAALLAAGPYARDPRVVGALPVHVPPAGSDRDLAAYRRWIGDTLARLGPEAIFVDTFPAGLLGELGDLRRMTRARLHHVARLLRWPAYAGAVPDAGALSFDRVHIVEPLHPDHEAAIRSACDDVAPLDLRDPPPPSSEDAAPDLPARPCLVVHSGPRDEIEELVRHARDLQRLEGEAAPLVVVCPRGESGPGRPSPDRLEIDRHPATPLFARAARIVTACGFNLMRQLLPFADRHRFMPLPRRYDDQFTRAARRRAAAARAAALLVLGALGLAVSACRARTPQDRLLGEFAGAYPLSAHASGDVRTFDLTAAEAELPQIDGGKLKVWAYDGQVPGPTLRVRLGDTVRVRFQNHLPQATTIHWHGVRLPNAMDGVPYLTQAPIEPGASFVYQFTPKDAGTFWFHPHIRSSEQVERGLYGVLIVEDASPAPYSRDLVWVLDDWLLDEQRQILPEFNTPHDLAHDGRWGNAITVNGHTRERLALRPGERVRLRLLDSANARIFQLDFSGLPVQVIAVDGLYLRQPIPYTGFEIAPGNRVDLDITAPPGRSAVVSVVDRFYPPQPHELAEIAIDGDGPPTPAFPSPAHARVPVWREALALPVSQPFHLNARRGGPFGIEWTINDQAMRHEPPPNHDGHPGAGHDATHLGPPAMTMRQGAFYRLQFINDSYRLHPIHLHGMFFRLLARNGTPVDEPFFRDTVLVHGRETVDVGVVPEDAGRWMMHCHILEHAEAGMMTTIEVRPAG